MLLRVTDVIQMEEILVGIEGDGIKCVNKCV